MHCDTHKIEIHTKNRGSIEERVVNCLEGVGQGRVKVKAMQAQPGALRHERVSRFQEAGRASTYNAET